jgi:IclR family KDG regulon transcriptional repressor
VSLTVEKALQLIEALSRSREPMGVSQLGRELDLNKSTVFRLVDTLVRRGYAWQDETSGRYALTPKLWELGVGVVQGTDIRSAARPLLEAEAASSGESTILGVLQDSEALIIDKVDSVQPLQIASRLGTRVPLCNTSLGRALLAFQPQPVIDEVISGFAPRTPHGIQTVDDLLRELESVRELGYSRSCDEWQVGIAGVAAPVRKPDRVLAAFCITGPTSRMCQDRMQKLERRCLDAAHEISRRLTYLAG